MNCGVCGLPIHEAEVGRRCFGLSTCHSEARCVELLKLEIAGLRDSLSAAERERDIAIDTRNRAQTAGSEAVLARQKLQAELDELVRYAEEVKQAILPFGLKDSEWIPAAIKRCVAEVAELRNGTARPELHAPVFGDALLAESAPPLVCGTWIQTGCRDAITCERCCTCGKHCSCAADDLCPRNCPACLEHRRHTEEDWKFHPERGAGQSREHGAKPL